MLHFKDDIQHYVILMKATEKAFSIPLTFKMFGFQKNEIIAQFIMEKANLLK